MRPPIRVMARTAATGARTDIDVDSMEDEKKLKDVGGTSSAHSRAFSKIMKKSVSKSSLANSLVCSSLGPVLADDKDLVAKKLKVASKESTDTESRKQKREERELAHVVPLTYTNAHEKTLIKVATRGVVLLFNAINKSQGIQSAVPHDSSKAVKAIAKMRKSTFLAELKEVASAHSVDPKKSEESDSEDAGTVDKVPSWSVLKDNFLLNKAKLKDWDKKLDAVSADGLTAVDDRSDED